MLIRYADRRSSMKWREGSMFRGTLLVVALILFCVAGAFGASEPFRTASPSVISDKTAYAIAPNVTAGLASLGFALAGGLSLLAASLVRGDHSRTDAA